MHQADGFAQVILGNPEPLAQCKQEAEHERAPRNGTMTDTEPIIDLLRSFTVRHDPWRVEDALDALSVFSGDHITTLTQALTDEDDELRLLAIEVLGEMGNEAEQALPALVDVTNYWRGVCWCVRPSPCC